MDLDPTMWRTLVIQQASTFKMLSAQEELARTISELKTAVQEAASHAGKHFTFDREMAVSFSTGLFRA